MASSYGAVDNSVLLGGSQSTMRAAIITRYGAHELALGEVPRPTVETLEVGHVLVRVHVVALNPVDVKTRRGATPSVRGTPTRARPVVLGYDCSGEIVGVGPGVPAGWNIGDEIMCFAVRGALCDHTMVHWEQLAHKPAVMSFSQAACLVTAGMTALQMLEAAGAMTRDGSVKRLFVTAGPGGVGHYALQLAKKVAKVPVVITTASGSKTEFVRRCGADEVIDYKTTKFTDALAENKCDAALDCTGEISSCKKVVRPSGTVVSVLGLPDASMLRAVIKAYHVDPLPCMCCVDCFLNTVGWCGSCCSSVRVRNIVTLPIGSQLEELANICVREHIVPTVDRVFQLEGAPAAFDYVEAGHVTGKVLVEIIPGAAAPASAAK